MDVVVNQIHKLSTQSDNDLKALKDFLRHEQDNLKHRAAQIEEVLQLLDPAQHTLGIAFLLAALFSSDQRSVLRDQKVTFTYVGNFLRLADERQARAAAVPMAAVCRSYAQMAVDGAPPSALRALRPLRSAVEKLRPDPETLTSVHAEYLRVCLKAKAYHLGAQLLTQPIFDTTLSHSSFAQLTAQSFLCYFYYGALIRIGLKQYVQALQLLLVVLTCPASCLSAIQADAFKKYVLVSLKVHGDLQPLPVYASHIVQRYAKNQGYVLELVDAFKLGDSAGFTRISQEKASLIQADNNMGLVKQVEESMRRHKLHTLTKTYLTLSLGEIAKELGLEASHVPDVEELLFDMVSGGEIHARIDQVTGNVSFEEDDEQDMDVGMATKMQEKLHDILELAQRIAAFEQEVVSSEAYIRKTAALEGERSPAPSALAGGPSPLLLSKSGTVRLSGPEGDGMDM
mmetsp:Transcript_14463/g.31738  ORF Transcript_14463/g.31738 Transcript_14463/m.31738 type:complete len:456 (-) Transcript_14463:84-1451(-)